MRRTGIINMRLYRHTTSKDSVKLSYLPRPRWLMGSAKSYNLDLDVTSGIHPCLSSLKNSLAGCGAPPSTQPPARM